MGSMQSQQLIEDLKPALEDRLLAMADDELILGHRDSEWCGRAPFLEEDIAFANLSLDEIGHASIWYSLLADLRGEDRDIFPDRMVYFRQVELFRNTRLVELPNRDWAFSMLRQYLFDVFETVYLKALVSSRYPPLAEAAAKIRSEEIYHLRHTTAWMRRLGHGTQESHRRLQIALDELWPIAQQLHTLDINQTGLVPAGYLPAAEQIAKEWTDQVSALLEELRLTVPTTAKKSQAKLDSRTVSRSRHTPHLKILVAELQSVARQEPEANW